MPGLKTLVRHRGNHLDEIERNVLTERPKHEFPVYVPEDREQHLTSEIGALKRDWIIIGWRNKDDLYQPLLVLKNRHLLTSRR